ncbi:MAG: YggS family pyridoxal phosphate-dependent enzyme [Opitutae bacterium]|jgi:PLP dependent protein|nr:YggS family pyridoxal phosphate-dependent enzyme [Opitutae bacterium]MBT5692134.1 YggS family pyridoxal phosphate-dependent enzyme [Opitutae bacterium]MBT6462865.1 YggS family pyridoxal phosphate-dependent enzyme [Opitutae bacterium]MBT6958776.1 YggS family pyridoxal phosphate-dependent enzyme [Opitutae bacterium]MBT7853048.1 YggS family pyridoxal phosphate-dependent enzyme [Opitutae bacterium]
MNSFSQFKDNLLHVRQNLDAICLSIGRKTDSVKILPVTKRQPLEAINFSERVGFSSVGENVVQEAQGKHDIYNGTMGWELIGHLQSNKARLAVEIFDRIQTVDSLKILQRIDRFAGELGNPQRILLQVNTSRDPAKHGLAPIEVDALVEAALNAENLVLEGFMTIGLFSSAPSVSTQTFTVLRELRDRLAEAFGQAFPELSMGMSGDLESAVKSGSTMIRVGTALFGERRTSSLNT